MIQLLNLQDMQQVKELLALQLAAYTIEAELINSYDIPPLKDTISTLQAADEIFYGYFIDGQLVGAISYKIEDEVLDIYRLTVGPAYFRRGIAQALLQFIEKISPNIRKIVVSTGAANLPATTLYQRQGFQIVGQQTVGAGILITLFEKILQ